ncbi:MAG TPA: type II toxin-antitoxin system HicB family antitoxin [Rhodothermales bacterium]|nr:type II toxin-antitoxin system HicB family antitoxin [Rhodothermales bacterium]
MQRYLVIIERPQEEGDSFGAYCPDLPGCIAAAPTEAEVIDLMAEAMEFHLEGLAKQGEPIPPSTVRGLEIAVREPEVSRSAA